MTAVRSVEAFLVLVLMLAGVAPAAGQAAGPSAPDPTAFLQQMVGEWSVVAEAVPGPGRDPVRTERREMARLLGGRWLVAESTGPTPTGEPTTSILTLGYDPAEERFVGTWIDSMQTHLWSYTGTLDDSGTTLTLETEGPVLGDPNRTARYREILEIVDADRRVWRTMIFGPDGEWFEFAQAEYRRDDVFQSDAAR